MALPTLFDLAARAACNVNWEGLPECISFRLYAKAEEEHRDRFRASLRLLSARLLGKPIRIVVPAYNMRNQLVLTYPPLPDPPQGVQVRWTRNIGHDILDSLWQ